MPDSLSQVFAALADPTRRDIVARLCAGDATVGELAAPYDVSLQAVSKHLKVLEGAGLVTRGRDAQRRPVHLEAEVFDLMTKWIERYRREAEARYQRLDAVLAEMNETEPRPDTSRDQPSKERPHDHHDRPPPDGTTTIEAPSDLPIIRMTREFAATPAQLFRAHTDADLFARWTGPDGTEVKIDQWDARTGGSWRYVASRGRRGVRLPRLLPHRPRGPHRPDLHLGGHARRGRPGDDDLRGARRRPHPAGPVSLCDSFEDRDAMALLGHGGRRRTTDTPQLDRCWRPARCRPATRDARFLRNRWASPIVFFPMDKSERPVLVAVFLAMVALISLAAAVPDASSLPAWGAMPDTREHGHHRLLDVRSLGHRAHGHLARRQWHHRCRPAERAGGAATAAAPAPTQTLPNGATKIFGDGRFLVAYYGTAETGALGVLGETSPDAMQRRVHRAAKPFARDAPAGAGRLRADRQHR